MNRRYAYVLFQVDWLISCADPDTTIGGNTSQTSKTLLLISRYLLIIHRSSRFKSFTMRKVKGKWSNIIAYAMKLLLLRIIAWCFPMVRFMSIAIPTMSVVKRVSCQRKRRLMCCYSLFALSLCLCLFVGLSFSHSCFLWSLRKRFLNTQCMKDLFIYSSKARYVRDEGLLSLIIFTFPKSWHCVATRELFVFWWVVLRGYWDSHVLPYLCSIYCKRVLRRIMLLLIK